MTTTIPSVNVVPFAKKAIQALSDDDENLSVLDHFELSLPLTGPVIGFLMVIILGSGYVYPHRYR